MLYKEALEKLAEVDSGTLEKATAHVTGNAMMSIPPLTAPAALLAAALTPSWTDEDVKREAAKSPGRHTLDYLIPGKGYYMAAKLDAYKKRNKKQ